MLFKEIPTSAAAVQGEFDTKYAIFEPLVIVEIPAACIIFLPFKDTPVPEVAVLVRFALTEIVPP